MSPLSATLLAAAIALSGCAPATAQRSSVRFGTGTAEGGDREAGATVFVTNCAVCHGATGLEGGVVGPSLRHESARMDYGALVSWIEDPEPPMPQLYPKMLTVDQVRDVAAYVESL